MKRRVLAVCAMLALAGGAAHAGVWGNVAIISSTLGVNANRLCLGEGSRPSDIGCPSYSPYITSGGLLGVGTSSPTATLQVSGSFIVSTSAQTTNPSLYVGTDGNVGIGTSSPGAALDVSGQLNIGDATNGPSVRIIPITRASAPAVPLQVGDAVAGSNFRYDTTNSIQEFYQNTVRLKLSQSALGSGQSGLLFT